MVEEANKLWVFFQKFIDEQAVDKIKVVRSPNREMQDKFEAMEWFARYVEFVTPDTIVTGYKAFRDKYATSTMTQERVLLKDTEHGVDFIPQVIESLKSLKNRIEVKDIDITTYDQLNNLLLMLMDPVLINNPC